jgi:hypothetical protein
VFARPPWRHAANWTDRRHPSVMNRPMVSGTRDRILTRFSASSSRRSIAADSVGCGGSANSAGRNQTRRAGTVQSAIHRQPGDIRESCATSRIYCGTPSRMATQRSSSIGRRRSSWWNCRRQSSVRPIAHELPAQRGATARYSCGCRARGLATRWRTVCVSRRGRPMRGDRPPRVSSRCAVCERGANNTRESRAAMSHAQRVCGRTGVRAPRSVVVDAWTVATFAIDVSLGPDRAERLICF